VSTVYIRFDRKRSIGSRASSFPLLRGVIYATIDGSQSADHYPTQQQQQT